MVSVKLINYYTRPGREMKAIKELRCPVCGKKGVLFKKITDGHIHFMVKHKDQSFCSIGKGPLVEKYPPLSYDDMYDVALRSVRFFCDCIRGRRARITYFRKTPPDIVCPPFWEFVWSHGCPLSCAWCYLQGTFRGRKEPCVYPYDDIRNVVVAFFCKIDTPSLLNSGELSDSLMHENTEFPFTLFIGNLMKKLRDETGKKHRILIVTKMTCINNLFKVPDKDAFVISFSINAEEVAKRWEKGAPSVERRLEAAKELQEAGFEIRFRIDPIVPIEKWEQSYKSLIERMAVLDLSPTRITLGTLRGLALTFKYAKDRSWSVFLKGGERTGWGLKMPFEQRAIIYATLMDYIKEQGLNCDIAMCKETKTMWDYLGLKPGSYPMWENVKCNCVW